MGTFAAFETPGISTGSDGRHYPPGSTRDGFAPQFLCLVYVKFGSAGISVRHAYFPMPADAEAVASAELSAVSSTGHWAAAPIRHEINFENFTFGSQQLIVFHLDRAGVQVRFDPANLIQFAEFSAQGQPRARNNSFLNAELHTWGGKDVLVLENWYTHDNGQPIAPPIEYYYTMNVHLLMRCALAGADDRSHELPLILDPDTGNMGGTP